jgi:hypothetical protein
MGLHKNGASTDSDDEDDYVPESLELDEAVTRFVEKLLSSFHILYHFSEKQLPDNLDWDSSLLLNETDFCFGNERLIYLPACGNVMLTKERLDALIGNGICRSSLRINRLLIRSSGTGEDSHAKVAFALKDESDNDSLLIIAIDGECSMSEFLEMIKSSLSLLEGGSLQLYRTPADTVVKKGIVVCI